MAAGQLWAPGTEDGPCADPCEHRDCASTRAMAEAPCSYCKKPIGYDRRFYRDSAAGDPSLQQSHASCAEAEYERRREAAR